MLLKFHESTCMKNTRFVRLWPNFSKWMLGWLVTHSLKHMQHQNAPICINILLKCPESSLWLRGKGRGCRVRAGDRGGTPGKIFVSYKIPTYHCLDAVWYVSPHKKIFSPLKLFHQPQPPPVPCLASGGPE